MLEFLARNWVPVLFLGGMVFMHFGMHRGHGQPGHGGGCGGGGSAHDGRGPSPLLRYRPTLSGHARGRSRVTPSGSPQDRPARSDTTVQAKDAPQGARRHRGC